MMNPTMRRWLPVALTAIVLAAAPLYLPEFRLSLLAKFLTYAIVAIALDLVWGYTGLLSLGHGVFFGLGAYATAMYLKLEASGGALPDFMGWSGVKELPGFWAPFANPIFALVVALVVPALSAGLVGYVVSRSRITGVYFSLITQAIALILSILFIGQQGYTGGTNGITNFSTIFGFSLQEESTQVALYLLTVLVLLLTYVVAQFLVSSRFGRLLVAVRDDEQRVRFCGFDPVRAKVLVLAISGAMSGLAGALFVMQVGIISPATLGIVPSVEMAIWVALGGRGTLVGAAIGAVLVNSLKSGLSESFPDIWQYFLGAILVLTVVLLPNGLVGFMQTLVRRLVAAQSGAMSARPAVATTRLANAEGKLD
jgi:urea transport system permease protein